MSFPHRPLAALLLHRYRPASLGAAMLDFDSLEEAYTQDMDPSLGITCHVCDKSSFHSWGSIFEHLRSQHFMSPPAIRGTFLHKQGTAELSAKRQQRRAKKACAAAMAEAVPAIPSVGVLPGEVEGYVGTGKASRTPAASPTSNADDADFDKTTGEELAVAGPAFLAPTAKCMARPDASASSLATAIDSLTNALQNKGVLGGHKRKLCSAEEEACPTVEITEEARDWSGFGEEKKAARRNKWPLQADSAIDLQDFSTYLEATKNLKPISAKLHVQKMRYFFGMLDLPDDFSVLRVFVGCFKSGVFRSVFDLPIMDPCYPTTRNIAASLSHFCDLLILRCLRNRDKDAKRSAVKTMHPRSLGWAWQQQVTTRPTQPNPAQPSPIPTHPNPTQTHPTHRSTARPTRPQTHQIDRPADPSTHTHTHSLSHPSTHPPTPTPTHPHPKGRNTKRLGASFHPCGLFGSLSVV